MSLETRNQRSETRNQKSEIRKKLEDRRRKLKAIRTSRFLPSSFFLISSFSFLVFHHAAIAPPAAPNMMLNGALAGPGCLRSLNQ